MSCAERWLRPLLAPGLRAIRRRLGPAEQILLLTVARQRRAVFAGRDGEQATWSRPGLRVVVLTSERLLAANRLGVRLELRRSAVRAARVRAARLGGARLELDVPHGPLVLDGLTADAAAALAAALGDRAHPPPARRLRAGIVGGLVPGLLADLGLLLVAPCALAVWFVALGGVGIDEIGDVGLIGALPVAAAAGLALLAAGFTLALARDRLPIAVLYVVALVFALYGALVPIEEVASFNVTWRHAGIADHLARAGAVDPDIDAYFNWPGFFAVLALAADAAGANPLAFAAWAPVVANLLYLPPVAMIARSVGGDARLVPLALWVFVLTNWVGQDYLSPQALMYGLFLVVLAVVLTWFGGPVRRSRGGAGPWLARRLRRRIAAEPPAPGGPPRAGRPVMVLLVIAMALATVSSHQLTPFALLLSLAVLVAFGRTWLRGLPAIVAVAIVAWIVFMAVSYLSGNIDTLRAQLGEIDQTLSSSVAQRVGGSDAHTLVVRARLAFTALLWLAALAAVVLRLRGGRPAWSLALLALAPFGLPLLQPYGGEILLRTYLFSLPAVAVLVASLVLALGGRGPWRAGGVVLATTVALGAGFLVTRHGNDRIWLFSRAEAAVVDSAYDRAPARSVFVAPSATLPWQHRSYAELKNRTLESLEVPPAGFAGPAALADAVLGLIRGEARGEGYVITTRTTRAYDDLFGSPRWGSAAELERALDASRDFRRVVSRRDGRVWVTVPVGGPR